MMAWRSINRNAGVVAAALRDAGLLVMQLIEVPGLSIQQDDGPSGIAEFEASGTGTWGSQDRPVRLLRRAGIRLRPGLG
jgi:hypothetical protein